LHCWPIDESGGTRIQQLLALAGERKRRIVMCMVYLGEVLYITERKRGLPLAQSVLALVESLPVELLDASRDRVLDAVHVKAHHALSYADAFVVASVMREQVTVLMGDPEFETVAELNEVEWLKE